MWVHCLLALYLPIQIMLSKNSKNVDRLLFQVHSGLLSIWSKCRKQSCWGCKLIGKNWFQIRQTALQFCTQYESSTCCTYEYSIVLRDKYTELNLAFGTTVGFTCFDRLLTILCAPCHPQVGTREIYPAPTKTHCQTIWNACHDVTYVAVPVLYL